MKGELKICFITGANSGIGKAAAILLAREGFYVLLGARNKERGEQALLEIKTAALSEKVELIEIDLSLQTSISSAARTISARFACLDVLIHNAADFDISRKSPVQTKEGRESIWATNHLGPIYLTQLLLPLLENSNQGRIITVASQGLMLHPRLTVDLKDPEFKQRKFSVSEAYYQSKLAQVMYTYWLAKELSATKITVNCVRVTNVKIDIKRYPNLSKFMKWMYALKSRFSISPEAMVRTYCYLASDPSLSKTTGKYFNEKNEFVSSSAYSQDSQHIEALMKVSLGYLG